MSLATFKIKILKGVWNATVALLFIWSYGPLIPKIIKQFTFDRSSATYQHQEYAAAIGFYGIGVFSIYLMIGMSAFSWAWGDWSRRFRFTMAALLGLSSLMLSLMVVARNRYEIGIDQAYRSYGLEFAFQLLVLLAFSLPAVLLSRGYPLIVLQLYRRVTNPNNKLENKGRDNG